MTSLYAVPIIDIAPFLARDPVGTRKILRHVTRACSPPVESPLVTQTRRVSIGGISRPHSTR
jgi:hypothetical protein